MSRPYTGKVITRQAEVKQKNGDVYVYERSYQYDRDKRRTVTLSNRLLGKKLPGSDEIVPTARRSPTAEKETAKLIPLRDPKVSPAGEKEAAPVAEKPEAETGKSEAVKVSDPEPGRTGPTSREEPFLRAYAERTSRVGEAVTLSCGENFAAQLLNCLWDDVLGETNQDAKGKMERALDSQKGIMETLFFLRSAGSPDAFWVACVSSEEPEKREGPLGDGRERVLMLDSEGEIMATLSVDADLDPFFALERAFEGERTPCGFLAVLDEPVEDVEKLRRLLRSAHPFLVRSFLETPELEARRASFLWRDSLVVCQTASVSVEGETPAGGEEESAEELTLHRFSFPREQAEILDFLYRRTHKVLGRLLDGVLPEELSPGAREMQERFLVRRRENAYEIDEDRVREEAERLSRTDLITNARMEPERAFSWYAATREFHDETSGRTDGEVAYRALKEMLEEAAFRLIERAAALGRESFAANPESEGERRMNLAAAVRLENCDLREILESLGEEPQTASAVRMEELLRAAAEETRTKT